MAEPSASPPPDKARRLLDERSAARSERDWATADRLRDELRAMGWEVEDIATGSTLRPRLPAAPAAVGYARPEDLANLLDEPPTVAASVQVVAEDHAEDLARLLRGLAAHPPDAAWQLVIVANAPSFDPDPILDDVALPVIPEVLHTSARLGWADARNLGLRRSLGEVTILVDLHVEPTGDIVGPLLAAFDDAGVGIAGGWGVVSGDARHFEEAPPGAVDAVEGYCLAVRRDALRAVGGFDHHFRFYRNADLDFSFAVRDAGWRAVRTPPLPARRHEHRGWSTGPEDERERLSRRNFYRFLRRWGTRRDLLLAPDDHDHQDRHD